MACNCLRCVVAARFSPRSSKNRREEKTAQRRALRRKGSVLDANLAEVRQLEQKMGKEDKGRMEQYLTSVREAEIRTTRADAWLDTPLPTISDADRKRTNRDIAANDGRRLLPHRL
jgi:hypothetical protein